jgi:hypothetical protein
MRKMRGISGSPDNPGRRALLRRAALVLGVSAVTPAVAAAVLRGGSTPEFASFSSTQLALVAQLGEIIIPATDTAGAYAAGVHHFIDRAVNSGFTAPHRLQFLKGLQDIDQRAVAAGSDGFVRAAAEIQQAIVAKLDREAFATGGEENSFFREFKELTLIGYYTSKEGASEELAYQATPVSYQGCIPLRDVGKAWATE